jgi:Tfp pilus assembly protein PilV
MRSHRRSRRPTRGFTLVEVMVAGTFFLVSFAGMITGISYATKQYEHQRNLTSAIAVSETVMEQLMLLQQNDSRLTAGNTYTQEYNIDGNQVTAGAANSVFTGSWTVVGDTPLTGLRSITLTISWEESVGTRNLVLESVRQ